jgi:TonB family protein
LPPAALPLAALLLAATAGEASAGGARLQVFFAADFKDQAYQQAVYQKVAGSWRRPDRQPEAGSKAVVIAVIQKDGKAPEPSLHHPSGSQVWDDAAVAAVRNASPFPPLPKTYAPAGVEVHFHFESVDEGGPAARRTAREGPAGTARP